jgi:hypothetical protein
MCDSEGSTLNRLYVGFGRLSEEVEDGVWEVDNASMTILVKCLISINKIDEE